MGSFLSQVGENDLENDRGENETWDADIWKWPLEVRPRIRNLIYCVNLMISQSGDEYGRAGGGGRGESRGPTRDSFSSIFYGPLVTA